MLLFISTNILHTIPHPKRDITIAVLGETLYVWETLVTRLERTVSPLKL